MSKSLGVFRNKTHLLLKYKDDQKQQINRFNKSNDLPIQSILLDRFRGQSIIK